MNGVAIGLAVRVAGIQVLTGKVQGGTGLLGQLVPGYQRCHLAPPTAAQLTPGG